jgi:hypothetical protein
VSFAWAFSDPSKEDHPPGSDGYVHRIETVYAFSMQSQACSGEKTKEKNHPLVASASSEATYKVRRTSY